MEVVRPVASLSPPHKTRQFLIDKCRTKYSWASGATRATPSARDRHRDDLEIAFSEINGLMAGMHYQDQVSEEYSHPLEISDDDLHVREDTRDYTPSPESMEDQPMASQWAAIRSLRKETEHQYNRFLVLASRSDDPVISDLQALYPNPKSIRTTGAQLVKDVLEGFRPQKLSHVFAFTFFSYAISKLLCKMDRFDRDDILRDLKTWRDLITDKRERQAFDVLAPELWPESRNHLHFTDTPEHAPRSPLVMSNIHPSVTALPGPADLSPPLFPFPQTRVQASLDSDGPFSFSFSELGDFDTIAPDPNSQGDDALTGRTVHQLNVAHEILDFSALDYLFQDQQAESHNLGPPFACHPLSPNHLDDPVSEREESQKFKKPPEDALEETVTFLVVLVFLQEIGELLYVLSGRTCLASRRHKLYGAQQRDQDAFYQSARKSFFEPYYQGSGSGTLAFMALLSVAETFTKGGYLRSIDEIERYLITLAAAVLPPGAVFKQFIFSIASRDIALATPTPASGTPGKRKRRDGKLSARKTKKRSRKCEWEGCDNTHIYKSLGALGKHEREEHIKPPPIPCGECDYKCRRLDRIRDHFLKQHPGIVLPERLEWKRKGGVISVQHAVARTRVA